MTDLNLDNYTSTVVEETVESKEARYDKLGDNQLDGMYKEAQKCSKEERPWKDSTLEAMVNVCVARGVISFNG